MFLIILSGHKGSPIAEMKKNKTDDQGKLNYEQSILKITILRNENSVTAD